MHLNSRQEQKLFPPIYIIHFIHRKCSMMTNVPVFLHIHHSYEHCGKTFITYRMSYTGMMLWIMSLCRTKRLKQNKPTWERLFGTITDKARFCQKCDTKTALIFSPVISHRILEWMWDLSIFFFFKQHL